MQMQALPFDPAQLSPAADYFSLSVPLGADRVEPINSCVWLSFLVQAMEQVSTLVPDF